MQNSVTLMVLGISSNEEPKDAHMGKDGFTALLGAGTEYNGKLNFKGTVRIDGTFIGEIVSEGRLIVGKGATIHGKVQVGELLVNGSIHAQVVATKIIILHKEAEVLGSVTTPRLEMEEGAVLQGTLDMHKDETSGITATLPLEQKPQDFTAESLEQ